ncbi:2-hydroxyglutaryl-CoA dehydratase [Anoxybacter fermentans]|uniref:2-hydroxyglutaryl-CoA dehydratase n=1 Tax=Anoxybacter fermentans TaxID=1323375 RepID=A0A3Q9HQG0_9FIRM|nr:acyl-CoA dehydratase activase [Anoxybacter fermentans]AZR72318.1 2-hydroxyglutaryl-CoA dehydratase [Anoxybacter fermentans]
MKGYLGIDVGSVSTNIVFIDNKGEVQDSLYIRTRGRPIEAVKKGLEELYLSRPEMKVLGVGTTGSGRALIGVMVGADSIKNEITAHAVAATHIHPDVRTVLEIGGQDSKIIIVRRGVVVDFAMNTVCAAGTGSFLDQQASRLGIPIKEFGNLALQSKNPVRIAGRCSVFAESDMIHKQQMGHPIPDIIAGLCTALVRNYLNNVGKGKEILEPVIFQGGVAANVGIRKAFEDALKVKIIIPKYFNVMGAIGAALLAREEVEYGKKSTKFKGFDMLKMDFQASSFECDGCPNHCEVINFKQNGKLIARWGAKCPRWEVS